MALGLDDALISQLESLGLFAAVISTFSVLGCFVAARLLGRYVFTEYAPDGERAASGPARGSRGSFIALAFFAAGARSLAGCVFCPWARPLEKPPFGCCISCSSWLA